MPMSSAASRYGNYSSSYSTSYSSSPVPRTGSGRTNNYLDSNYTSGSYRSRPLPVGPGPLDSTGTRRLSSYGNTSTLPPRSRPSGPLKADHTSSFATSSKYNVEKPLYGTTSRARGSSITTAHFGGEDSTNRPISGRSRLSSLSNKSNSLVDLSDLRITSPSSRGSRGPSPAPRVSRRRDNTPTPDRTNGFISGRSSHSQSRDPLTPARDGLTPSRDNGEGYTPSSRESSPPTRKMLVERNHANISSNTSFTDSSRVCCGINGNKSKSNKSSYSSGGKVGLKNLGNTCFMNSVLQCLSNTPALTEWLLDGNYQGEINTTTSSMKGSLIKAYAALMNSLWRESGDSVAPTSFKTQIQKFAPRFMGYNQQDSQEFLRYLLEGLHEDVNRVTHKTKAIILEDSLLDTKNDNGKALEYWKAYINRDDSHIVDLFVGQLMSELVFTPCGHRSVTFDPFWDLSLPIPRSGRSLTLDDCMQLFMKEEELGADERPTCTKCKQRRSCTKRFSIHKFPRILVLHLKRFSQERYGRKLTALVDFPQSLELGSYAGDSGKSARYSLYAVSNHSGGTGSGHYTAYARNPYSGDWLYYNDSRVSSTSASSVVSAEAYVLFYQLTGSPASKSRI